MTNLWPFARTTVFNQQRSAQMFDTPGTDDYDFAFNGLGSLHSAYH